MDISFDAFCNWDATTIRKWRSTIRVHVPKTAENLRLVVRGKATTKSRTLEKRGKEVLSVNSENESSGKNSEDIASSSSSSGINSSQLKREFLYVGFTKREEDGEVWYVADPKDDDARLQFLRRFRTGQTFFIGLGYENWQIQARIQRT